MWCVDVFNLQWKDVDFVCNFNFCFFDWCYIYVGWLFDFLKINCLFGEK